MYYRAFKDQYKVREKKETVTVSLVVSIPQECHRGEKILCGQLSTDATSSSFFRVMHFVVPSIL